MMFFVPTCKVASSAQEEQRTDLSTITNNNIKQQINSTHTTQAIQNNQHVSVRDVRLMSGVSPELLLLGHEEEIENQVSEILLQDFNDFQKFALAQNQQQDDGFDKRDLMDEAA